jgi:hypothetical protein
VLTWPVSVVQVALRYVSGRWALVAAAVGTVFLLVLAVAAWALGRGAAARMARLEYAQ